MKCRICRDRGFVSIPIIHGDDRGGVEACECRLPSDESWHPFDFLALAAMIAFIIWGILV